MFWNGWEALSPLLLRGEFWACPKASTCLKQRRDLPKCKLRFCNPATHPHPVKNNANMQATFCTSPLVFAEIM